MQIIATDCLNILYSNGIGIWKGFILQLFFLGLVGCNDAFVEVGMPRSPSHSANASDLKQMMSSSKQSCTKRQTVELLQGTKNSHLQYVTFTSIES